MLAGNKVGFLNFIILKTIATGSVFIAAIAVFLDVKSKMEEKIDLKE